MLQSEAPPNPRTLAVFSFRFDAHLVSDLLENIKTVVDGWISYDDRGEHQALSNEPARRTLLVNEARRAGARWVLAVDPDERFESGLGNAMEELTSAEGPVIWNFRLREMYSPDKYRIDGLWGSKRQGRLFSLSDGQEPHDKHLHGAWAPPGPNYRVLQSGFNLYHLRMIEPARRRARRDLYSALDPKRSLQPLGYDYLIDEKDAEFEEIPSDRQYHPPHREDGQLWMPEIATEDTIAGDDPETQLRLAEQLTKHGNHLSAANIAARAAARAPKSVSVLKRHAVIALRAGLFEDAAHAAKAALDIPADRPVLRSLAETAELLAAEGPVPPLPEITPDIWPWADARRLFSEIRPGESVKIKTPWLEEPVRARLGGKSEGSEGRRMSVVVIGLGAPSSLARAVDSVLSQSPACDVIVVNTGGGNLGAALGARLDSVLAIEVTARGYAGAARNLGVIATRAPRVSFLAGDCVAEAGWIRSRLEAHDSGARAVAGSMLNTKPDSALDTARSFVLFPKRQPFTPAARASRYSASYDMDLFVAHGLFDSSLRIAEDTEFNSMLRRAGVELVWRPEVAMKHNPAANFATALFEMWARGRRTARATGGIAERNRPLTTYKDVFWAAVEQLRRRNTLAGLCLKKLRARGQKRLAKRTERWVVVLSAFYAFGWLSGLVGRRRHESRIQRASGLVDRQEFAKAWRLLIRTWRTDKGPAVLSLLAKIAEAEGRTSEFDAILAAALRLPSRGAHVLDVVSDRSMLRGELDEASYRAAEALSCRPLPWRWVRYGSRCMSCGDVERGRRACLVAARIARPKLVAEIVDILNSAGLEDDALIVLRHAIVRYPDKTLIATKFIRTMRARQARHQTARPTFTDPS